MSIIQIIEGILKDEFPEIKNIKANLIANRILDAMDELEERKNENQ